MNKKEILSKAQKEPDEMELDVTSKALGISTIIIPLLCLIFIIARIINNNYIVCDLIILVLSQVLMQEIYQYLKMKNKKDLVFIIIISIFLIISLVFFINEVTYERFINFKK